MGSTSLPGLASKDVIDIQLTLGTLEQFEPVRGTIEALGYQFRPDIMHDHIPLSASGAADDWAKRYFFVL